MTDPHRRADDGISFSSKELFQSIDAKLEKLDGKLDNQLTELRKEIRDVRHTANNIKATVDLARLKQEQTEAKIAELQDKHDINDSRIDVLERSAVSQEAVDSYKRWLVTLFLSMGGLGLINLWMNLNQSPPP